MKKIMTALMIMGMAAGAVAQTEEVPSNNGGLESLRGISELNVTRGADKHKRVIKDREPLQRNYVHQPPIIPHQVRGYKVNLNANKCLSCHGWKYARETGATKVSPTHFETRDGMTLSDISPRRYFCMQCHVPQVDGKPLVKNEFKPVDSLTQQ
jgi:nitrate reductase (cytochrome), electron transfer subunit